MPKKRRYLLMFIIFIYLGPLRGAEESGHVPSINVEHLPKGLRQRGDSGAPSCSFIFRVLTLPEVYTFHKVSCLVLTN